MPQLPIVIDVRAADDSRDVVHRAVQALMEGKLVAFPMETAYGLAASALNEEAVDRLLAATDKRGQNSLTLAVKNSEEARDYVPHITPLGQRLTRHCWPGPITLAFQDNYAESLFSQLSPKVREAVTVQGAVRLRVPGHPLILDVLRMMMGPAVICSAGKKENEETFTSQEVVQRFGPSLELVLDDGRSRFCQPASEILVEGNSFRVLKAGVVSEQTLKRLSNTMILFVCTGNTCRSPMAERLFRKMLSEKLKCKPDQLGDKGVTVVSAGTSGMMGGRATREAIVTMSEMGIPLEDHESQPLTGQLIQQADLILVMTSGHRQAILKEWPQAIDRTYLLSGDRNDISDPIGGPQEEYRRCAQQIENELKAWVEKLEI